MCVPTHRRQRLCQSLAQSLLEKMQEPNPDLSVDIESSRDSAEQESIEGLYELIRRDANQQESINALYSLIQKDAYVLDKMDKIPFVETPLHIAASVGRTLFAMEIMRLMPSFARKLNQDGFSPMHLALQKLHEIEKKPDLQRNLTQLVERLLDVDSDIVRVSGKEGMTPFHYVAQMGNLDLLTKFSEGCPKSYEDVTIRKENVLHVALKHNQVLAFRLMLGWIGKACFKDALSLERKLLYWKDEEHNTLLHVAVSKNQSKVVSLLLCRGLVDFKAKNLEGKTVFDLLERQTQDKDQRMIRDMLMSPKRFLKVVGGQLFHVYSQMFIAIRHPQTVVTEERRNALLVVATLLITVTYQAVLSPDKQYNQFNCTASVNATGANQNFNCTARFNASSSTSEVYSSQHNSEVVFLFSNTIAYFVTNVILFLLLPPDDFLGLVLSTLLLFLSICYYNSTPVLNAPSFIRVSCIVFLIGLYSFLSSTASRLNHFLQIN